MIRFTAADRAKAIEERSAEDFAKRSYKPVPEDAMSLAKTHGADKRSILDGWVHPAERPAQQPRTEVLYGREWSAEDAAYARELAADLSLTVPDLARLWATNRPSVRAGLSTPEPSTAPSSGTGVDVPAIAPVEVNAFERWLAGSGLTLQQVADRFGVSRQAVHKWKAKGAPADVMSRLDLVKAEHEPSAEPPRVTA